MENIWIEVQSSEEQIGAGCFSPYYYSSYDWCFASKKFKTKVMQGGGRRLDDIGVGSLARYRPPYKACTDRELERVKGYEFIGWALYPGNHS